MPRKTALWLVLPCAIGIAFAVAGCAPRGATHTDDPKGARIIGGEDTPILCCWFVEDDGSGKHGYAAADGRRGWLPAEGGGLFPSIQALRSAMERQGIRHARILPEFDDEVPKGWKIRALTTNEVNVLVKNW